MCTHLTSYLNYNHVGMGALKRESLADRVLTQVVLSSWLKVQTKYLLAWMREFYSNAKNVFPFLFIIAHGLILSNPLYDAIWRPPRQWRGLPAHYNKMFFFYFHYTGPIKSETYSLWVTVSSCQLIEHIYLLVVHQLGAGRGSFPSPNVYAVLSSAYVDY